MKPLANLRAAMLVSCVRALLLLAMLLGVMASQATVLFRIEMNAIRTSTNDFWGGTTIYLAYPGLGFDSNSVPITSHRVFSQNTNHSAEVFPNGNGGSGAGVQTTLEETLHQLTNGVWTLILNDGHATAQTNTFTVAVSGIESNFFPVVTIVSPADGQIIEGSNPLFQWLDDTGWSNPVVEVHDPEFNYFANDILPEGTTNWLNAPPVPVGTNVFKVRYKTGAPPQIVISTPITVTNSQPLTNWQSTATVFTQRDVFFYTIPASDTAPPAELKGHFSFDNATSPGEDTSGENNHVSSSVWCAGGPPTHAPASGVAGGAFAFNGTNWLKLNTNLAAALQGDFSVSLWFQTANSFGANNDPAFFGAGIVSAADYAAPANWMIPMSLTGSKLAFLTSTPDFDYVNAHSTSDINTGDFVHLVVTRAQATGTMKLYVNGVLETLASGPTNLFDNFTNLALGSLGECNKGTSNLIDEVQIYTGVLTSNQVAFMFANPTETAPPDLPLSLGEVVDAPQFTWSTGGATNWFGQTTNTHDLVDAAEVRGLSGFQSSYIETTVQGPGIISFWWKVEAFNFDYVEFYIDGDYQTYNDASFGWYQEILNVPGGSPKTLRWEFFADSSLEENDHLALLDEVSFTPIGPVQLLSVTNNNSAFQLQFQSNNGFEHIVEYRNSFQTGNWLFYTNLFGDGGIMDIVQPATNIPSRFFRVLTQ